MVCQIMFFVGLLLLGVHFSSGDVMFCTEYCLPGQSCWPSSDDFKKFSDTLDGKTLMKSSTDYAKTVKMKNTFETKSPYMVVLAESVEDVQKSMIFAREKSIRVAVFSSGHDYIGRSTGDDVLMISLEKMKKVSINLSSTRNPAGEITAESGNTWARVYRKVDSVKRVIVGGSAQTVSMGGYNLGGGHSPMSRKLGLAVDNLLEVQMVTVDGRLLTVNANGTHSTNGSGHTTTDKDDLFWALRGGGGGTFGVAVSFTMKLHYAPDGFVSYTRFFAMIVKQINYNVGKEVMNYYQNFIKNLPNEWSGYLIMEAKPTPLVENMQGLLTVHLLHFGGWSSASRAYLETFAQWQPTYGVSYWVNHTSFMDYKKNQTDPIYYKSTIQNTLVQETDLDGFGDLISSKAFGISKYGLFGCSMTHLGGQTKVKETPDVTSVNPALRTAVHSASCGLAWEKNEHDGNILSDSREFNKELLKHGAGVYLNEPAETESDWIKLFWGDTTRYEKLTAMKIKYDPQTFLLCKYCVRYDVCKQYLPSSASMLIIPLYEMCFAILVCLAIIALSE